MNYPYTDRLKNKRILINVPNLHVKGGVTNYFNALELAKHDSISYFFVNRQNEGNWLSKGIFLPLFYIKFLWRVKSFDLVHLNVSLNFKSYYRDMGFLVLLKLLRKQCVVFFHGWESSFENKIKGSGWKRKLFQQTYGQMDACIVLGSIYEQKLKILGVKESCTFHLETTVADDTFIKEDHVSQKLEQYDPLNILFLARILKEKGVYIALEAFKQLQSKLSSTGGPRVSLTVAGDGPELDRAKAYASEEGIPNVTFIGYVQGQQKHDVLVSSHILLFPTYYPEGQPSVNLEAMLYGMPVVTRSIAGVPDLLKHGDHGLLTLETDTEVFADLLEQLVMNHTLRHKIGWENHQKAMQEFVPSKVVPRILAIYEQALASRPVRVDVAPSLRQRSA